MTLTLSAENIMPLRADASTEFSANTLYALHHALVSLRALAYQAAEPRTIGRMLDDIEYLGVLAMQSRSDDSPERIENFRLHLQDLEAKYSGFEYLTAAFEERQNNAISR